MHLNDFFKLVVAIAVSELAGISGSFFTISVIPTWYATLQKPAFSPPSWVFGPVWTALYALMGVALWLVWKSDSFHKIKAISLFAAQLALNALWSPVFFGFRSIGDALAIIVLLWAVVVLTIFIFSRVSRVAAYLLIPYILWISFAAYLNFSIWRLN